MDTQIILEKIDKYLRGYDCMLIETGGKYDGKGIIEECVALTVEYLRIGGNKGSLSLLIEKLVTEYENYKDWAYLEKMMRLLNKYEAELHTV